MLKIEMRDAKHLWIIMGTEGDLKSNREVIIDLEHEDVRVVIGNNVVKVCFFLEKNVLRAVLLNDVFLPIFNTS